MKVYLAGPINACDDGQAKDWRATATALLAAHGLGVIDPMRRDFRGVEGDHTAEIVQGDKADIEAAHALLAYAWQPSAGTSMEILYAYDELVPVVAVVPSLAGVSPWIKYHADAVVTSVEAGVEAVVASLRALDG